MFQMSQLKSIKKHPKDKEDALDLLKKLATPTESGKKRKFYEFSTNPNTCHRIVKQHSEKKSAVKVKRKIASHSSSKEAVSISFSSSSSNTLNENLPIPFRKEIPNDDSVEMSHHSNTVDVNENVNADDGHSFQFFSQIDEVLELLRSLPMSGSKKRKRKTWHERQINCLKEWDDYRESIWDTLVSEETVDKKVCFSCEKAASIKCKVCPLKWLCRSCDVSIHKHEPLHDRSSYLEGYERDILPTEFINEENNIYSEALLLPLITKSCSSCGSEDLFKILSKSDCFVVTMRGRFDMEKYTTICKDCQTESDPFCVSNLLKHRYWPGNPKSPTYIFAKDVFIFWNAFRKRMPGSSERSFLSSLCDISSSNGRNVTISIDAFSMAFKEWNFAMRHLDILQGKEWMDCPSCSINQHSGHVDGNCKLYRYASSGRRKRESHYKDVFFCNNLDVQAFINKIHDNDSTSKKKSNVCGGIWTAAANTKYKGKSLDETGLEVCSCRHSFAQKGLNMYRGELFAYPLFLIKNHVVLKGSTFCFADMMCKLWPYACKHEESMTQKIKPALSIMHAKGHSLECQVKWSGEWIKGTGRSTGEETEQVFGYLSRFSNVTKYQLPEKREETITEMVLGWNKRKYLNFVLNLHKRHLRIEKEISTAEKDIQDLKEQLKHINLDEKLEEWVSCIKDIANDLQVNLSKRPLQNSEKFLLLTSSLANDRSDLLERMTFPKKISPTSYYRVLDFSTRDIEQEMELRSLTNIDDATLENAYESLKIDIWAPLYHKSFEKYYNERCYIGAAIKKVSDSSKRHFTLRKRQGDLKKIVNEFSLEYCQIFNISDVEDFKSKVYAGQFPWRNQVISSDSSISGDTRRLCVERYLRLTRLLEERQLIAQDMASCIEYFYEKLRDLQTKEENFEVVENQDIELEISADGNFDGKIALIKKGKLFFAEKLRHAISVFGSILKLSEESYKKYADILPVESLTESDDEGSEVSLSGDEEDSGAMTDSSTDYSDLEDSV